MTASNMAGPMQVGGDKLYCSECQHFRPERSWRTLWGARRDEAASWAQCACPAKASQHYDALDAQGIRPVQQGVLPSVLEAMADSIPGHCSGFAPATPDAEAKWTMMKLEGEKCAAAQKQPGGMSSQYYGQSLQQAKASANTQNQINAQLWKALQQGGAGGGK